MEKEQENWEERIENSSRDIETQVGYTSFYQIYLSFYILHAARFAPYIVVE